MDTLDQTERDDMNEHRAPEAMAPRHGTGAATDEAFSARRHDVVTRRTSKGGTTAKVVKRGTPYIIGSWTHDADGAAGWSGAVAVAMPQHAGRFGARASEILEVTQALFGDEIGELLGSDVLSFEEIVHPIYDTIDLEGVTLDGEPIKTTIGPDPTMCRVAVSHARLTGSDRVADVDAIASDAAEYEANTQDATRWPTRYRLRTPRPRTGETEQAQPGELFASADDPTALFVGHRKINRTPTEHAKRGGKRDDRTIARDDGSALANRAALDALIARLNHGDRVTIGAHVVVTRSQAGRFNITDRRPNADRAHRTVRTVSAAVNAIA